MKWNQIFLSLVGSNGYLIRSFLISIRYKAKMILLVISIILVLNRYLKKMEPNIDEIIHDTVKAISNKKSYE